MIALGQRFWAKVDRSGGPDGCWVWTGGRHDLGYGRVSVGGRLMPTHRLVYEATHGPIPDGLFVCHHCDNPPCCNPAHLFAGTQKENLADMVAKGRALSGERATCRTLALADVLAIRARYCAGGVLQRELADEFGVAQQTVSRIVRRERWVRS